MEFRSRGGTALVACLVCVPAGAYASHPAPVSAKSRGASLELSSRAGAPGDVVRVVGRRFPRGARVVITLDARRVLSARTSRRGKFVRTFAVPSRPAGRYGLVARSGRVRVRMRFRVVSPALSPIAAPIPAPSPAPSPTFGLSQTSPEGPPPDPPPPPPPPPPEPKTLVAAGDIVCHDFLVPDPNTECRHAQTADRVEALKPDAVATLGDNQYEFGELINFQTEYEPTWGVFKKFTHPAVGNHEYEGVPEQNTASGYFDYFNGEDIFTGPAGDRDKGYYSWSLGSWTVFVLNSGALGYTLSGPGAGLPDDCWPVSCSADSDQVGWLRAELEALPPDACVVAYWHHPRFSSGSNNARHVYEETGHIFQALYEHGVELALTAHAHNYERFTPVDHNETPNPAAGVRQFVVGTGGRSIYSDEPPFPRPTSEKRIADAFGVLELTLLEDSYSFRFVDENGNVRDKSDQPESCHDRPGT